MTPYDLTLFFAVMAVATFLTRAVPFVLMQGMADQPWIQYLGRHLPPLLMAVLVIYGLMTLPLEATQDGVLTAAALAITLALHWRWRQPLLSILGGTGLYVLGRQWPELGLVEGFVLPLEVVFLQFFQ